MTEIRAVIVDDERLARRDLRVLLKAHPQISIIGEADTLETAIEVIGRLEPDVVFLDIQMPGGSGFTVLNSIDPAIQVVFVTAYDEYAVRAFEVDACDYLLKPVNPKRLAKTIARLQSLSEPVATAEPEKSPALSLP
ncbi:MAG TPA: response regulator, partial [Acidobacteriota bacterium]|nr:response regulator [Acidobacteriota bacterium]